MNNRNLLLRRTSKCWFGRFADDGDDDDDDDGNS